MTMPAATIPPAISAPEIGPDEAERLAHQATAWTTQAHKDWFWAPIRTVEE
jgi:hypothetical protein